MDEMDEFVDADIGLKILADLERKEPYQWLKNQFSEEYSEWAKAKKRYDRAVKQYPMAMKRAESKYFR